MSTSTSLIEQLIEPVSACLTPETATRLLSLRANPQLQQRVDQLAEKANLGTLAPTERDEYEQYLNFSQFITLLQIEARNVLDQAPGDD